MTVLVMLSELCLGCGGAAGETLGAEPLDTSDTRDTEFEDSVLGNTELQQREILRYSGGKY